MNFLSFLIGTDYILSISYLYDLGETTSIANSLLCTSLKRNSRWSFPYSGLTCWLPILKQELGFNLVQSTRFFLFSPHITPRFVSSLRCSSSSFMVFQQFSFFVAWLHKTMSTYQFLDMLTCSFPYIPIAKARGFTGISDNTFLLILDYLIAIQKLLLFLPCFSCLLSLLSESFSNPFRFSLPT